MRRSWVLADGERKKINEAKVANSSLAAAASTSNQGSTNTPAKKQSAVVQLEPAEANKIKDCVEKMSTIKYQTEDLNPEVIIDKQSFYF